MTNKALFYSQLADKQTKILTSEPKSWYSFITASAQLYKYSFVDQLMIYAQRPDAVACAPIETWNSKFGRWVRRGSKGIALLDDKSDNPHLRYVFDISDTEAGRYNSTMPHIWQMKPEYEAEMLKMLSNRYGVEISTDKEAFAETVKDVASMVALDYVSNNAYDIMFSFQDNPFENSDIAAMDASFLDVLRLDIMSVGKKRFVISEIIKVENLTYFQISPTFLCESRLLPMLSQYYQNLSRWSSYLSLHLLTTK